MSDALARLAILRALPELDARDVARVGHWLIVLAPRSGGLIVPICDRPWLVAAC
jgi:hypothetical protein